MCHSLEVGCGQPRLSTDDQHLDLLRDTLRKAGCERFLDNTDGGVKAELTGCVDYFFEG
ncbi:recombinase family protein [Salmonella enterica]|nr:recombinase family protein [Salmonella enterica]EAX6581919.1 recombinase family protein [Salmonella enterica]